MHTKQQGSIAEMMVAADLMAKGYYVFLELGDLSRTDLIAEKAGKLTRIQVKSTTQNDKGIVRLYLYKTGPDGYKYFYSTEDVDCFALVDLNTNKIAYIPASITQTHHIVSLRTENFKGTNAGRKSYDFADFVVL